MSTNVKVTAVCAALTSMSSFLPAAHALVTKISNVGAQVCTGSLATETGVGNDWTDSAREVFCPFAGEISASPVQLRIYVWDRNPQQDVVCTVYGKDSSGTIIYQETKQTGGLPSSRLALDFFPLQGVQGASAKCSLPPSGPNGRSEITDLSFYSTN